MSGKRPDKPAPIELSQPEVDDLVAGRKVAAVSRRLNVIERPRTRAAVRTKSTKPAPPALKRNELTAIRAGRISPAVRKRLFADASEPSDSTSQLERENAAKPYPTEAPPSRGTRKRG
jgi:hypothetical protein